MRYMIACLLVVSFAATSNAQMPALSPEMTQQLQAATGKLKGESLGAAIVMGTLVGCAQKQVGPEKTKAFYAEIEKVGKTGEALCKLGKTEEARQLIWTTFEKNQNDPVLKALLQCYDKNAAALAPMAGPKLAADMAHYAGWVRDPQTARTEIMASDVCHNAATKTTAPSH